MCALPIELAAAEEILDEEHGDFKQEDNDSLYSLGSINGHNVVIGCLPAGRTGNNMAAVVGERMRATFKGIQFGLMVGIGGGVPSADADIRLGDVVVSHPDKTFAGVVQYDFGKDTPSGFKRTGSLNAPPEILLNAVARVRKDRFRDKSKLSEHIARVERKSGFQRSKAGPDVLFEASYDHEGEGPCDKCAKDKRKNREPRKSGEEVVVHYGTIASGNQVMRNATERDKVSAELDGVLCFEMEGAGLMNTFPCLVVRGICDYSDSHKNKKWQPYAAGTAAAYAKEVLSAIPPAIRSIPFLKNPSFAGRKTELDTLKQRLIVDKACDKMSIVGPSGTGKTQLALQFAHTVKESWPETSIFWVPAMSLENFEQACADVAKTLGICQAADGKEDAKELVRQHLSTARAGKWLLVVDNANDMDILFGSDRTRGVADYLPQSKEGVVLFTTRTPEAAGKLTGSNVLELGAMDRQDATTFLTKTLTKKELLSDSVATTDLLDELACLPLAIAQAAAYVNRNRTSIREYLRLLRNTEPGLVNLMSREFYDARYKGMANAVATTWAVSFSQIRAHDEVAVNLLSFMSCIEWKAIPQSILLSLQSEVQMTGAISTLCAYSFLARRGDSDWYDVHQLVHLATRIWLKQNGNATGVAERGIRHMASIFPSNDYANQAVWRAYLPHAVRLLKGREGSDIKERSKLALSVGQCLQVDGRIPEAVKWLEESCKHRAELAEGDPDRLSSQHALAGAYQADGQAKKAVELLERVVGVREKVLAEDHPSRLASQHALAGAYRADRQIKKAVELLERVVAAREKVLAEDHPSRLASQYALAGAYQADSQVKKAVELLERVVGVREKVLAEDHPNRLASQHALAEAYRADGRVKKAVELLERVITVEEKVLAEGHPNRLASQHALGRAYQADGQVKKAVELLRRVVTIKEKVLAEGHPSRLASQHELAKAYQADGQVKKAVELLEYVVTVKRRVYRADHPSRLVSERYLRSWQAAL